MGGPQEIGGPRRGSSVSSTEQPACHSKRNRIKCDGVQAQARIEAPSATDQCGQFRCCIKQIHAPSTHLMCSAALICSHAQMYRLAALEVSSWLAEPPKDTLEKVRFSVRRAMCRPRALVSLRACAKSPSLTRSEGVFRDRYYLRRHVINIASCTFRRGPWGSGGCRGRKLHAYMTRFRYSVSTR